MTAKAIQAQAKRLHTHVVVFSPESDEEDCAVRAMLGQSTAAIAAHRGLTVGQVSYRIKKGGLVGARAAYRNGQTSLAKAVYKMGRDLGRRHVQKQIAPQFAGLAPR